MTEAQVKEKIGENNWEKFMEFMHGQTTGVNRDGSADFYECDVDMFLTSLKRPLTPWEFD